ncbi:hypothetical protein MESS4_60095 [Mesorhizobium sp. STM 4661]|nr:hypothetical protein MESS4_60095 [Mesorhizobium sp. STM 4661]
MDFYAFTMSAGFKLTF